MFKRVQKETIKGNLGTFIICFPGYLIHKKSDVNLKLRLNVGGSAF